MKNNKSLKYPLKSLFDAWKPLKLTETEAEEVF